MKTKSIGLTKITRNTAVKTPNVTQNTMHI